MDSKIGAEKPQKSPKAIKVFQICTSQYSGGAASIARQLHEKLAMDSMITSHFISREETFSARTLGAVLNFRVRGKDDWTLDKLFWKKLIEQKTFQHSVVHLHNIHGYFFPLEFLSAIHAQAEKILITAHDQWWATGRCACPPLDCHEHLNQCQKCPDKNIYPKTFFKRNFQSEYQLKRNFLANKCIQFIAPSHSAAAELTSRFQLDVDIKVIRNGIKILPQKTIKTKDTLVCGLDSLYYHKGWDLALELLESANDQDQFDVLINNKKNVLPLLKNIKCKVNLVKAPKSHEQFIACLADYQYIVIPSRSETFGLLALEAAIAGTRPILFKLPAFKETLGDYPIYAQHFYEAWSTRATANNGFIQLFDVGIDRMVNEYRQEYLRDLNA